MFHWIMTLQAQQSQGGTGFATMDGTTQIIDPAERFRSVLELMRTETGFQQSAVMFYHVEPIPPSDSHESQMCWL
jgi:hypothetical protein